MSATLIVILMLVHYFVVFVVKPVETIKDEESEEMNYSNCQISIREKKEGRLFSKIRLNV